MTIWKHLVSVHDLNKLGENSLVSHIGIEFTEIGENYICAKMPVNHYTQQPDGLLHGGASVVLAETLGSVASNLCVDRSKKICVGLDVNANHVRTARSGYVVGITKPVHLGASTHIWEIRITNEDDSLVCIARLTMAVLDKS
jgi:1,4-dihydroxy-2-naphthoyl-CoA hydrolase